MNGNIKMDIRVKTLGEGELEKAIVSFEAAQKELRAAALRLTTACANIVIRFEEIKKAADTKNLPDNYFRP